MNILIFILLITHFCLNCSAEKWNLIKDKNEIYMFELSKPNYQLNQYKIETIIKKDMATVLAALQDTSNCQQWVYNCISNKMVKMIDVRKRIYHTIVHSPLWFKDRDFFIESHVIYEPNEKKLIIDFDSKPEYAEESIDKVRITDVDIKWVLKYLSADMTLVTYQIYIDPKLPIKAINQKMIQKSVYETIIGLTKIVENPVYAQIKYSEYELEKLSDDS
jgi:hypothetical protein